MRDWCEPSASVRLHATHTQRYRVEIQRFLCGPDTIEGASRIFTTKTSGTFSQAMPCLVISVSTETAASKHRPRSLIFSQQVPAVQIRCHFKECNWIARLWLRQKTNHSQSKWSTLTLPQPITDNYSKNLFPCSKGFGSSGFGDVTRGETHHPISLVVSHFIRSLQFPFVFIYSP